MAEPTPLEPELCNRLTRYLHTGNELPKYFPGCWTTHNYFTESKLPVMSQIMELHPGNVESIDIIVKVNMAFFFFIMACGILCYCFETYVWSIKCYQLLFIEIPTMIFNVIHHCMQSFPKVNWHQGNFIIDSDSSFLMCS